jgi:hypothetical protein
MLFGLPDPDPSLFCTDPDPALDLDPSISTSKKERKNLISTLFVTYFRLFFLSMNTDVNVPSKSNKSVVRRFYGSGPYRNVTDPHH